MRRSASSRPSFADYFLLKHDTYPRHVDAISTFEKLVPYSHLVAVHYTVCKEWVLWDDGMGQGSLTTLGDLTVHRKQGAIQLWYGNRLVCEISQDDHPEELYVDDGHARVTVQRLVDSDPRDTAAARLEAAAERTRLEAVAQLRERQTTERVEREANLHSTLARHGLSLKRTELAERYIDGSSKQSSKSVAQAMAKNKYLDEYCPAFIIKEYKRIEDDVMALVEELVEENDGRYFRGICHDLAGALVV
ncbi:hypothetical protein T492DRAFT_904521 [Pavlovales sp. CCMP2436]|nr:hypothetical protein T492DRAFT_904521 [Pavlovales sp. CCMP2436]